MTQESEDRLEKLIILLESVVEHRENHQKMHEEEHRWIRLQMKNDALSAELKQAVVTKVVTGGIWAFIVGVATVAWLGLKHIL